MTDNKKACDGYTVSIDNEEYESRIAVELTHVTLKQYYVQAETLLVQIRNFNKKFIFEKKRRCLCGITLFNLRFFELYNIKLSFNLSFALRIISIVNILTVDEIFNLPCGKENTSILNLLFMYRKVSTHSRICLLALKPKEFIYSMKQSVLRPNNDLTGYNEFSEFKKEYQQVLNEFPNHSELYTMKVIRLKAGLLVLCNEFENAIEKAKKHYCVDSSMLQLKHILFFLNGLRMPNCLYFHGCSKLAQGSTDFCTEHGGGYRCQQDGCETGAIGTTGFCSKHGYMRRCLHEIKEIFGEDNSAEMFELIHTKGIRNVIPIIKEFLPSEVEYSEEIYEMVVYIIDHFREIYLMFFEEQPEL